VCYKVRWPFLQQVLQPKDFDPKWYQWITNFISRGRVSIRVNDDVGHHFQTQKGLRQGDLFSPILFNIIADVLAIMIDRAKEHGQVEGLIPHLVDGGVSILQYANDSIIFMEHNLHKALNMKLILNIFSNFWARKLTSTRGRFFLAEAQESLQQYCNLFG
jgi:hypothetical protein